jgi:hypothetical protein
VIVKRKGYSTLSGGIQEEKNGKTFGLCSALKQQLALNYEFGKLLQTQPFQQITHPLETRNIVTSCWQQLKVGAALMTTSPSPNDPPCDTLEKKFYNKGAQVISKIASNAARIDISVLKFRTMNTKICQEHKE